MSLPLRTRRELALLNAQQWSDFKAHWPMRLFELCYDLIGGVLLGFLMGLALFIWALSEFAA